MTDGSFFNKGFSSKLIIRLVLKTKSINVDCTVGALITLQLHPNFQACQAVHGADDIMTKHIYSQVNSLIVCVPQVVPLIYCRGPNVILLTLIFLYSCIRTLAEDTCCCCCCCCSFTIVFLSSKSAKNSSISIEGETAHSPIIL